MNLRRTMRRYADGSDTEVEEKPKAQGKGKPSAQFLKFWDEVYDKGKKKVSNPNQTTKKTHPNVSASTAMKTPAFQAKVKKEFKAWLQQQDDKPKKPESKSEPKEPAKGNTVLQLDPSDLKDAFEHASEFLDEELDPDDFEISKPKRLSIKELAQYDDLSSWSEWGEGDLAEMDEDERREELENFRGDGFADRAEAWLKGGKFPPIVVVESEQGAVIGDGRGRASIAIGMGIPIDVVFARQKSKKASLSSLVLKVAQSNSHVRRLLISELGKTLRN